MSLLDAIGWVGSALLIYSVMQARVLRFRVLNLAACIVLTGFNAALEIWPMVAMNVALCLINLWHIRKLLVAPPTPEAAETSLKAAPTFAVVPVDSDDRYLAHVMASHASDIARHQPSLDWQPAATSSAAFLVQQGDETAGVVLIREESDGTAQVLLDYVTPRFRDFSAGRFVWRRSTLLRDRGYRRVITPRGMVGPYYGRLGFTDAGDGTWVLDLSE